MNEGQREGVVQNVTGQLVAGYAEEPRTQRLDGTVMPVESRIIEILHLCFQVLFPGYFGSSDLSAETIQYHIGSKLAKLDRLLAEQIVRCCRAAEHAHGSVDGHCRQEAHHTAAAFLRKLPELRAALNLDVEAAYDGDPAARSFDEIIFCYPGFQAVMIYRIAHELHRLGVPLMPRIMTEHGHNTTGVDIHPGATIGKRFFIDHGTGVVIGETTEIGDNVKIYQGVTLGALSFPKDERGRAIKGLKRHPTLQDNVTVYANATILGGETIIGKGVTVGGNTFVTASVNADSLVSIKPPELTTRPKRSRSDSGDK